jgi:hypothetical protein
VTLQSSGVTGSLWASVSPSHHIWELPAASVLHGVSQMFSASNCFFLSLTVSTTPLSVLGLHSTACGRLREIWLVGTEMCTGKMCTGFCKAQSR